MTTTTLKVPLEGPVDPYDDTNCLNELMEFDTEIRIHTPIPFEHVLDASYTSTQHIPSETTSQLCTEAHSRLACASLESAMTEQYGFLVAPYVYVQQTAQLPDPEIQYDLTSYCNLSPEAVHLHDKTARNDADAQPQDYIPGAYATEPRVLPSRLFATNEQHQHQWWMHVDNGSPNSHSSPTPSGSPTPSWNGEVEDYSRSPLGSIRCNYTGCTFRCGRREALRHHQRSHIPMAERPYPCPNCPMRFLYPREVGRHLTTHGIGTRHYCPHERCRYATEGFGRRDHLVRHMQKKHNARSVC